MLHYEIYILHDVTLYYSYMESLLKYLICMSVNWPLFIVLGMKMLHWLIHCGKILSLKVCMCILCTVYYRCVCVRVRVRVCVCVCVMKHLHLYRGTIIYSG